MEAAVLRGQVGRSDGESSSAGANVDRLGQVLLQRALNHDLLADVAQRVGDGARWDVAPEHVAHVLAGASVARHVRKVPVSHVHFVKRHSWDNVHVCTDNGQKRAKMQ